MKYMVIYFHIFLVVLVSCSGPSTGSTDEKIVNPPETECTFTNPLGAGQDPWVVKDDGRYLFLEHGSDGIKLSENRNLTDIKSGQTTIWTQPADGWNSRNLWAPELHKIQNEWVIYYAAGTSGPPFTTQRSGALRAVDGDPFGEWEDMGMLYTGDDVASGTNEKWAIDLTVLELGDRLFAIWSGWEFNEDTDRTPQHLYIAEMENPWTISSDRVKISSPEEEWEKGTELAINEGPEILKNDDGDVFIIYSASESWLPAYKLGQLKLTNPDQPMSAESWEKTGPVFQGTSQVYGVGHASFTTSPDGREHWIVYHTKTDPSPGWDRVIHMQPFEWNSDGSPNFGTPVPGGVSIDRPSGACDS